MNNEEEIKEGRINTMENVILNNKLECPVVGIGTFMLAPADAENSVREALKMGYRLIDTANAYVNERAVGRGMKDSGVKREEIFLSTKLWPSEYENDNAVDETLERLGVDYVDLLYIHQPAGNWLAGYRQLEKAYREGKAKSIGISNFEGKYIEELDFKLTEDEMAEIAKLDKDERYYHRTEEQLVQFAGWKPEFECDNR